MQFSVRRKWGDDCKPKFWQRKNLSNGSVICGYSWACLCNPLTLIRGFLLLPFDVFFADFLKRKMTTYMEDSKTTSLLLKNGLFAKSLAFWKIKKFPILECCEEKRTTNFKEKHFFFGKLKMFIPKKVLLLKKGKIILSFA